jgi:hemeryth_dom: hemerythrin-like metal-binding domain
MTYDLNITFDDNLVTGNETIDTQHKELIDRIQNFVTACQNGDSKVKAIKMLDYLDEYTDFHFKEEEKLQENPVIQSVKNIMKNMKSLKDNSGTV